MTSADNWTWRKLQDSLKRSCKFSISLQWCRTMNLKHFNIRKWPLFLLGFLLRCAWAGGRSFIHKHGLAVLRAPLLLLFSLPWHPARPQQKCVEQLMVEKLMLWVYQSRSRHPDFTADSPHRWRRDARFRSTAVCPFEWRTSCRMKQGNTSFNKSAEVLHEPRGSFIACFILVLLNKMCKRQHLSERLPDILWGRPTNYRHPLPVTVEV